MDKVNKQELRRLAEKALPEAEWFEAGHLEHPNIDKSAARFMAFANPAAILSLLDELEQCKADANDVWGLAQGRADTIDQLRAELEQYRKDAESLRGSCKALGEQNKLLTRRVKSLARAVNWLADTGWGVARPKWLTAILAKEGGANG